MLFFFSKSNALRHLSVLFLLTCHSNILLGARLLSEDSINDENDYEINDIESRVEGRSEGEIAYKSEGIRRRSEDFGNAAKSQKT